MATVSDLPALAFKGFPGCYDGTRLMFLCSSCGGWHWFERDSEGTVLDYQPCGWAFGRPIVRGAIGQLLPPEDTQPRRGSRDAFVDADTLAGPEALGTRRVPRKPMLDEAWAVEGGAWDERAWLLEQWPVF
jgi:hypothetical protein|tara:strand:+ start:1291 stop:1683 length:393 start_codon:yes stop_codon:yes gene_type:complete